MAPGTENHQQFSKMVSMNQQTLLCTHTVGKDEELLDVQDHSQGSRKIVTQVKVLYKERVREAERQKEEEEREGTRKAGRVEGREG